MPGRLPGAGGSRRDGSAGGGGRPRGGDPVDVRELVVGRESLRGHLVGDLPDLEGLDSPLRRFRTFTDQGADVLENVHDKVLFTVRGAPKGSRVRLVTLDRYDGREWLPSNNTEAGTADDAFLRIDSRVDNPLRGRRCGRR